MLGFPGWLIPFLEVSEAEKGVFVFRPRGKNASPNVPLKASIESVKGSHDQLFVTGVYGEGILPLQGP